jgi:hypothetical protein
VRTLDDNKEAALSMSADAEAESRGNCERRVADEVDACAVRTKCGQGGTRGLGAVPWSLGAGANRGGCVLVRRGVVGVRAVCACVCVSPDRVGGRGVDVDYSFPRKQFVFFVVGVPIQRGATIRNSAVLHSYDGTHRNLNHRLH